MPRNKMRKKRLGPEIPVQVSTPYVYSDGVGMAGSSDALVIPTLERMRFECQSLSYWPVFDDPIDATIEWEVHVHILAWKSKSDTTWNQHFVYHKDMLAALLTADGHWIIYSGVNPNSLFWIDRWTRRHVHLAGQNLRLPHHSSDTTPRDGDSHTAVFGHVTGLRWEDHAGRRRLLCFERTKQWDPAPPNQATDFSVRAVSGLPAAWSARPSLLRNWRRLGFLLAFMRANANHVFRNSGLALVRLIVQLL